MEQKIVNRLPSKTWNWLKVNEAVLDWDNDRTTDLGAGFFAAGGEENEPIRVEIEGKGEYSYKAVNVTAKAGSRVTVYEIFRAEANLAVETRLTVRENATVRLIQVQATQPGSVLYNSVKGECADGGRIELTQVLVGRGDDYAAAEKPDYETNLIFARRLSESINRQLPDLCRNVIVKKGRYNQQMCTPAILLEIGHNMNTLEQALNTVPYVANAIETCLFTSY